MRCSIRDVTPAMVLPPWRSRSSWVLSVLLIDSITCRNGLKYRCPGRGFSPLRAGRSSWTSARRARLRSLAVVVLVAISVCPDGGDQIRVGVEQVEQSLALVGLGPGQGEGDGQTLEGAHQVQAQPPKEAECEAQ